ncbi:MAG: hypothetical protein ACXVLX_00810 [Ilumatobacteraceae bacterium]
MPNDSEHRTDGPPALLRLPIVYALALALRDAGMSETDIAARLGQPVQAMPALLRLAEAKEAALRRNP